MFKRLGISTKITIALSTLVLSITLITLVIIDVAVKRHVDETLRSERERTAHVLREYVDARSLQMDRGLAFLVGASDFQALVSTDGIDRDTLLFTMKGMQKILESDILVLVGADGRIRARTDHPDQDGQSLTSIPAVKSALAGKGFPSQLWLDGEAFQIVARPIVVSERICGCVLAAVKIDAHSAQTLRGMLDREVSFIHDGAAVASTFDTDGMTSLNQVIASRVNQPSAPASNATSPQEAKSDVHEALTTTDMGEMRVADDEYLALAVDLDQHDSGDRITALVLTRKDAALGFYAGMRNLLLVVGVGAQIFAIGCGYWLASRGISRPIQAAVTRLRDIAEGEGDLTQRIDQARHDELGELGRWFNQFVEKIEGVIKEVKIGAAQIDSGGVQIASASQSIAQGASDQANSLQEISASVRTMSSQTQQSADSAREANALAEESKGSADRGRVEMNEMEKAVNDIRQSSSEVSKIIRTIDEIAFQTNLLALNAAVEAARAGEAGKGFAVVADEVRSLAKRSADAAKDTAALIDESVKRAENGVQIVGRVGKTLQAITGATDKINTLLAQIAASTAEQATGIERVNRGVSTLDQVTQQNAGSSEEMASSAQELSSQVASLNRLVTQFKVTSEDAGTALTQKENPTCRLAA